MINKKNKDFVLIKDNFISKSECDILIKKYKNLVASNDDYYGYSSHFINDICFSKQLELIIKNYSQQLCLLINT